MNIYWCHEKDEGYGLFVKALTRGRAKDIYACYVECRLIDVRTNIMRRGINEDFEGVLDEPKGLEKYGLSYGDEEAYYNSPDPLWCEDCQHFKNYPLDMGGEGECDIDKHNTWYGCPICEKFEKKGGDTE